MNLTRRQALKSLAAISAAAAIPSVVSAAANVTVRKPVALLPCDDHTIEIVKRLIDEIETERGYPINPVSEFISVGCPACIAPKDFFARLRLALPRNILMAGWYFENGKKLPYMPDLDPHCISVKIDRLFDCFFGVNNGVWKTYDLGPNSWIEENINA